MELEQQAKVRLTGGAILVVLLVLLVPELLTGPRPAPQSVAAQPDQAPMRSYNLDIGDSVHGASGPVAASTTVPAASEPMARLPAPPVAPAVEPLPAMPHPVTHPAVHPPARAVVPASAPAAVPNPPAALADNHAPPREHDHNVSAGYTVQLGTFSSRDNAARLVAAVKSHGFGATILESSSKGGHKLYRVRVGAERDRAAAQKLLARLRAAGQKGGAIVAR